jgi:hypothetical protein
MSAKKMTLGIRGDAMRGEFNRTHLTTALELAVALLTAFFAATLLTAVPILVILLSALLTLLAAGFLSITLTAWSLLTAALLTTALIFFTIVCHDFCLPCSKC